MYKLDRTAFKIQTFQESDDDVAFWKSMSIEEVFDYAWMLTCQTYKINAHEIIRMDKTVFEMHKNG